MGCNVDTGSTMASSTGCRAVSAADLKCLLPLLLWSCCSQGYFSQCVFLTAVQCFALIPEATPASLMGLAASCSRSVSEMALFGIGPLQPSCYQNYCGHPITGTKLLCCKCWKDQLNQTFKLKFSMELNVFHFF